MMVTMLLNDVVKMTLYLCSMHHITHNLTLVMRKAPGKPQLKGILQNTHYSSKLSRSSKARKLRSHLIQEKPKEACSITQRGIYVERQKL